MTREEAARVLEIWKRYISKVDDIEEEEVNAIFAAIDALRGHEWVRSADRLPLNLENELVVIDGKITLGLYDHNCWFFYNEDKNKWQMDEYDRVTHWMPLPKLPEVEV